MSAHSGRVSRPRCMPRRSPRAIFLCRVSPSSSRTNRVSPPRRYVKYRAPSSREKNIWRPVCRAASCSSVSGMPSPVGQGRGKSIRRRWRSSTIRSGPKARQQADNRFSISPPDRAVHTSTRAPGAVWAHFSWTHRAMPDRCRGWASASVGGEGDDHCAVSPAAALLHHAGCRFRAEGSRRAGEQHGTAPQGRRHGQGTQHSVFYPVGRVGDGQLCAAGHLAKRRCGGDHQLHRRTPLRDHDVRGTILLYFMRGVGYLCPFP